MEQRGKLSVWCPGIKRLCLFCFELFGNRIGKGLQWVTGGHSNGTVYFKNPAITVSALSLSLSTNPAKALIAIISQY
jgi:hypothetical protein